MKVFLLLLTVTLCTVMPFLPGEARAEAAINCPYDIQQHSILYRILNAQQKQLFNALYNAIRAGDSTVNIPDGLSLEEVYQIQYLICQETPELIAYDHSNSTVSYRNEGGKEVPVRINIAYRESLEAQESYIRQLSSFCNAFRDRDEKAGILRIHDFLCDRITYDKAARDRGDTSHLQRFYDSLSTGLGVCNAYAQGMTVLCHFSGYRCSYISGYAGNEGHAWNILAVNGRYTYADVTWDDRDTDGADTHIYFGMGYDRFYAVRRNDPEYPVFSRLPAGSDLEAPIAGRAQLYSALTSAAASAADELTLCFTPAMYSAFCNDERGLYGVIAEYGVTAKGCSVFDKGFAVVFRRCSYRPAEPLAYAGGHIQADLTALKYREVSEFMLTTDKATMQQLLQQDFRPLKNRLAMEGALDHSLSYNSDACFIVLQHVYWQAVNIAESENELRALLRSARNGRLQQLTVVLELSLFDTLTDQGCRQLKEIMSECRVYGAFSYNKDGYIRFTDMQY